MFRPSSIVTLLRFSVFRFKEWFTSSYNVGRRTLHLLSSSQCVVPFSANLLRLFDDDLALLNFICVGFHVIRPRETFLTFEIVQLSMFYIRDDILISWKSKWLIPFLQVSRFRYARSRLTFFILKKQITYFHKLIYRKEISWIIVNFKGNEKALSVMSSLFYMYFSIYAMINEIICFSYYIPQICNIWQYTQCYPTSYFYTKSIKTYKYKICYKISTYIYWTTYQPT